MFGFGAQPTVDITLADEGHVKKSIKDQDGTVMMPIYQGADVVRGKVKITCPKGSKVEHIGIKVEVIGQIDMYYDKSSSRDFTSLVRELSAPGKLDFSREFDFEFSNMEKQFDSYNGMNVRLRYFIRVTISRQYSTNIVKERDFWVQNVQSFPEINNTIKMEVGIEDCLHIEFEYNRSKYSLDDVCIGRIYFLLVRIKIKHMELAIIKREQVGSGQSMHSDAETVTKFEIMDGAPVKGEVIPVRLFLAPFDLTPTYRNINNKFSVKYHLNLVLVDDEDRRYFKQQEIALWRKKIG